MVTWSLDAQKDDEYLFLGDRVFSFVTIQALWFEGHSRVQRLAFHPRRALPYVVLPELRCGRLIKCQESCLQKPGRQKVWRDDRDLLHSNFVVGFAFQRQGYEVDGQGGQILNILMCYKPNHCCYFECTWCVSCDIYLYVVNHGTDLLKEVKACLLKPNSCLACTCTRPEVSPHVALIGPSTTTCSQLLNAKGCRGAHFLCWCEILQKQFASCV